jgi:hypothetical protein
LSLVQSPVTTIETSGMNWSDLIKKDHDPGRSNRRLVHRVHKTSRNLTLLSEKNDPILYTREGVHLSVTKLIVEQSGELVGIGYNIVIDTLTELNVPAVRCRSRHEKGCREMRKDAGR